MRKKTVRDGLRLLVAAITLLIMGTFYSREIGEIFFLSVAGAMEFVHLAFFWGGILGGVAIVMICVGFVQSSCPADRVRLLPAFLLLLAALVLFFLLFFRSLSSPPVQPLRPGETLII